MPPSRRLLLTLAAGLLAVPTAASAEPVVVAGPPLPSAGSNAEAPPQPRLLAEVREGRLCLSSASGTELGPDGEATRDAYVEAAVERSACEVVPAEDLFSPLHLETPSYQADVVGGAVRADVAVVELRAAGGALTRMPTVPAPPAFAGTVAAGLRFYVGTRPERVLTERLLAADGSVVHEEDEDRDGLLVRGPRRVAAGAGWSAAVEVRHQLAPARGDAGRRVRATCLVVRRAPDDPSMGGRTCLDPGAGVSAAYFPDVGCGPRGRHLVAGFARAGATPSTIVTTSGRRHAIRSLPVPAGFGEPSLRVVLGAAGPGDGIRWVEGGPIDHAHALPPTRLLSCSSRTSSSWLVVNDGGPALGGETVLHPAGAGGPRLYVRDRGAELCTAVKRGVRAGDCAVPKPGLLFSWVGSARRYTVIAGVVDARVRAVRVRLASGRQVTVPAAPDPAYTGRYARTVAFFAYAAPPGDRVVGTQSVLPGGTRSPFEEPVAPPTLTTDAVHQATVRIGGRRRTIVTAPTTRPGVPCLVVTAGTPLRKGDRCPFERSLDLGLQAKAGCRTGLTVAGLIAGGARTVVAVLRSGRRIVRPVVRLRDGEHGFASVPVPRRAAVARVELRGPDGALLHRYRLPAPPASAHCGYATYVDDEVTVRS